MRIDWSILEIFKTIVVGVIGLLADMACLFLLHEFVFTQGTSLALALSVAIAFFIGVCVNYLLACRFVFIKERQRENAKDKPVFLYYLFIFGIGFILTEALMLVGTNIVGREGFWYLLVRLVASTLVFFWDYLARKIFIYQGA